MFFVMVAMKTQIEREKN